MVPCKILSPRGSVCSPHGPSSRQHPKGLSRRLLARSSGLLGSIPTCLPAAPALPLTSHALGFVTSGFCCLQTGSENGSLGYPHPLGPSLQPLSLSRCRDEAPAHPQHPKGEGAAPPPAPAAAPPRFLASPALIEKYFPPLRGDLAPLLQGLAGLGHLSPRPASPPPSPSWLVAEPSLPASTMSLSPLLPSPVTFTRNLFKCF